MQFTDIIILYLKRTCFLYCRKMSWKLSYHVTTMDNKIINNKYDTAPTFNDTKDSVNVTSPLSKAYVLVDVKEVYRLSQVFTVVMNRRIYNADKDKFENAVKQSLTKTLKGMKI